MKHNMETFSAFLTRHYSNKTFITLLTKKTLLLDGAYILTNICY